MSIYIYIWKESKVVRFSYDPSHFRYLKLSTDHHTKDYAKSSSLRPALDDDPRSNFLS